jgi:integrase/recombinase XerD
MADHPPPDTTSAPDSHQSRFRGVDGVTTDERDLPPTGDEQAAGLERAAAASIPAQLDLFTVTDVGAYVTEVGGLPPVSAHSSLDLARSAYRRHLERSRRPRNTIESYCYDLHLFEEVIGPKPLNRIERQDVARFLGEAHSKSTRKRRLTSLRRFFRYLIDDARALRFDPTDGYYPHQIRLRSPVPLFADEQEALLDAARADEPWSALAIWLMMRLGLTRAELLALERDHIDRTQPHAPVVHVVYDELAKQSKERRLAADADFAELYDAFLDAREIEGRLFPVGPQAVNGMVERVRKLAGITKDVTPQTLRATFAVEQARAGADQQQLLALLGLVNDPRNRQSVDRYLALAADPLAIAPPPNP